LDHPDYPGRCRM